MMTKTQFIQRLSAERIRGSVYRIPDMDRQELEGRVGRPTNTYVAGALVFQYVLADGALAVVSARPSSTGNGNIISKAVLAVA